MIAGITGCTNAFITTTSLHGRNSLSQLRSPWRVLPRARTSMKNLLQWQVCMIRSPLINVGGRNLHMRMTRVLVVSDLPLPPRSQSHRYVVSDKSDRIRKRPLKVKAWKPPIVHGQRLNTGQHGEEPQTSTAPQTDNLPIVRAPEDPPMTTSIPQGDVASVPGSLTTTSVIEDGVIAAVAATNPSRVTSTSRQRGRPRAQSNRDVPVAHTTMSSLLNLDVATIASLATRVCRFSIHDLLHHSSNLG